MHIQKYILFTFCFIVSCSMRGMVEDEINPTDNSRMIAEFGRRKDLETIKSYFNSTRPKYVPEIPWKPLIKYKEPTTGVTRADKWEVGTPVNYHHDYDTYKKEAFICNHGGIYTATRTDKYKDWAFDADTHGPKDTPLEDQWNVTVIKQPLTEQRIYEALQGDTDLMNNKNRHIWMADDNSLFGQKVREFMKPHAHTLVRCGRGSMLGVAKQDGVIDIYNKSIKTFTCSLDAHIADMIFPPCINNVFFVLGQEYQLTDFVISTLVNQELVKVTINNKNKSDIKKAHIPTDLTCDPLTLDKDNNISLICYETSTKNPDDNQEYALTFTQDLEQKRCNAHKNDDSKYQCMLRSCFPLKMIYDKDKKPISLLYLRHFPHLHTLALQHKTDDTVIDLSKIPNTGHGMHITRDLNTIISAPETYTANAKYYDPVLKKYFNGRTLIQLKANLLGYGFLSSYRADISDNNPNHYINLPEHWEKLKQIYQKDKETSKPIGDVQDCSIISSSMGKLYYQTKDDPNKKYFAPPQKMHIAPIAESVVEEAMEQEDTDVNIQQEAPAAVTQHNNLVFIQQRLDRFKKNIWTIAALPSQMKNSILKPYQFCMPQGSLYSFATHPEKPSGFIHYREHTNNNQQESRIKYIALDHNSLKNNFICELDTKIYTRGTFIENDKIAAYLRPQSWLGIIQYLLYPTIHIVDRLTYKEDTKRFTFLPGIPGRLFRTQSTWKDFFGRCKDVWHMMRGTW